MSSAASNAAFVILLLGPPGCGKEVQAEVLAQHYGFVSQSKLDCTSLTKDSNQHFQSSVDQILSSIKSDDEVQGIIFDNVPATLVGMLEETCQQHGMKLNCIFLFDVDNILNLLARACLGSHPNEGTEDTNPQNVLNAIHEYMEEEPELMKQLEGKEGVFHVDGMQSQVECTLQLMEIIDAQHGHTISAMSSILNQPSPPDPRQVTPAVSPCLQYVSSQKKITSILSHVQQCVGNSGKWSFPGGLPAVLDAHSATNTDSFTVFRRSGEGLGFLLLHPSNQPVCYLVDHALQVFSARCSKEMSASPDLLLEGELVQLPTGHGVFYIMDVLFASGEQTLMQPHRARLSHVVDRFLAEAQLESLLYSYPQNALLAVCKASVPGPQLPRVVQEIAVAPEGNLLFCHKEDGYQLVTSKRRMEWKPPERPTTLDLRLLASPGGGYQFFIGRMGKNGLVKEVFLDNVNLTCQRPEFQNLASYQRTIVRCVMLKPHVWQIIAPKPFKSLPDAYDSTLGMQQQLPTWRLLELAQGLPSGSLAPKPMSAVVPDYLQPQAPVPYLSPQLHSGELHAQPFVPSVNPIPQHPHHFQPAPMSISAHPPGMPPQYPPPVPAQPIGIPSPPQPHGMLPPQIGTHPHMQVPPVINVAPPYPPTNFAPPMPASLMGSPQPVFVSSSHQQFNPPPHPGAPHVRVGPSSSHPFTDPIRISPHATPISTSMHETNGGPPSPPLNPADQKSDYCASLSDSAVLCIGSIMNDDGNDLVSSDLLNFPSAADCISPTHGSSNLLASPNMISSKRASADSSMADDQKDSSRIPVGSERRSSSAVALPQLTPGTTRRSSSMWAVTLDESLIMSGLSDTWDNQTHDSWTPGGMGDGWAQATAMSTPAPRVAIISSPMPKDREEDEYDSPEPRRYRAPSLPSALEYGGRDWPKDAPTGDLLTDNRFTKTFREQVKPKPDGHSAMSPLAASPMWTLKSPMGGPWAGPSPSYPRGGRRTFRDFNNIAKMWLIQTFAPTHPFAILDLCCRRGNDIHKWHQTAAKYLLGCDPSAALILDATERAKAKKQTELQAEFFVGEPFSTDFALPSQTPHRRFGVVSCMFAIQNAFRDESTARHLFTCVADLLEDGGIFMGTTVDSTVVLSRLAESSDGHEFGNNEYTIQFEGDKDVVSEANPFGHAYRLKTFDDGGEWEEYLVLPGKLRQLAEEAGLTLSTRGTRNFCLLAEDLPKGKGKEVWNQMGPAERELVQLYTTFVFRK